MNGPDSPLAGDGGVILDASYNWRNNGTSATPYEAAKAHNSFRFFDCDMHYAPSALNVMIKSIHGRFEFLSILILIFNFNNISFTIVFMTVKDSFMQQLDVEEEWKERLFFILILLLIFILLSLLILILQLLFYFQLVARNTFGKSIYGTTRMACT